MVPGRGVEPPRDKSHWLLRPARLPFRHPGNNHERKSKELNIRATVLIPSEVEGRRAATTAYFMRDKPNGFSLMDSLFPILSPARAGPARPARLDGLYKRTVTFYILHSPFSIIDSSDHRYPVSAVFHFFQRIPQPSRDGPRLRDTFEWHRFGCAVAVSPPHAFARSASARSVRESS